MKVTYSPRALRQLEDIHAYIEQRSTASARVVIARIRERCEKLGEMPGLGSQTDQARVRMLPVLRYPYLIFYAVRESDVRILRVRHGARAAKPLTDDEIGG